MSENRGVFHGASSALAIASKPLGSSWARSFDRCSVPTQTLSFLRDMSLGQTHPPPCPCPGSLFQHQRQGRPHRTVPLNPQPCNCGEFQILGQDCRCLGPLSTRQAVAGPWKRWPPSPMSPNHRHVVIRARLALVVSPRPRVDRLTVADAGDGERAVVSPQRRTDVLESVGAAFRYLTPQARSPAGFLQPVERPVCGRPIGKIPLALRDFKHMRPPMVYAPPFRPRHHGRSTVLLLLWIERDGSSA